MPLPLSITRIRRLPACSISMKISVAPASTEFSISSLTTDAGRSTTSPAAILFTIWSGSIFIMEDIIYRSQKTAVRIQTNTGVLNRLVTIEFRISKATRSNSADQQPAADLPLLQGEGRGEDGLVQRPLNTHPHLNPPLEGEKTYFRSWGKKTSYCITFAEVNNTCRQRPHRPSSLCQPGSHRCFLLGSQRQSAVQNEALQGAFCAGKRRNMLLFLHGRDTSPEDVCVP